MTRPRNPDIKRLPPKVVQKAIATVRHLNAAGASLDELKKALEPVFRGWRLTVPVFDPGVKLFRGRKVSGDLSADLSAFSYPPPEKVGLGRANRANDPVFYCATSREAIFFETKVSVGDKLSIVHYETDAPLTAMSLGYTTAVAEAARSARPVPDYGQLGKATAGEHDQIVNEFLSELFTSDHPARDYAISVAIAEKMLVADMVDGLMYPTLAMSAHADNIALKPRYVDQHLSAVYAECASITKIEGQQISLDMLDEARHVRAGTLAWLGHPGDWTVAPLNMLQFEAVEGHWVARDPSGSIVHPT